MYIPWGERFNGQHVATSTCIGHACDHEWGWLSWMFHRVDHPDSFHCKHLSKNVMVPSIRMLYPIWVIHLQQDHSSATILSWFKNGCSGRTVSNSLTGHHERLVWIQSRICEVGRRKPCRKPGPFSLRVGRGGEALWSLAPDAGAAREREEPMLVLQLTDLISRGYWCSAFCSVAESSHTSWKINENNFFFSVNRFFANNSNERKVEESNVAKYREIMNDRNCEGSCTLFWFPFWGSEIFCLLTFLEQMVQSLPRSWIIMLSWNRKKYPFPFFL